MIFSWPFDGIGELDVTLRSSSLSLCCFKDRILSIKPDDPLIKSEPCGEIFCYLMNETDPLKLLRGTIVGDYYRIAMLLLLFD